MKCSHKREVRRRDVVVTHPTSPCRPLSHHWASRPFPLHYVSVPEVPKPPSKTPTVPPEPPVSSEVPTLLSRRLTVHRLTKGLVEEVPGDRKVQETPVVQDVPGTAHRPYPPPVLS